MSAPVATDATSLGPFTQEEVSEVLSHYRRASEPGSIQAGAAGTADSLNISAAYAANSVLHGNPLLPGTAAHAALHREGPPQLPGAQAPHEGLQLPEPLELQGLQALSAQQLRPDQQQTAERMLQALL